EHYLVPTKVADLMIPDEQVGMVLEHETIEPVTYCVEWCPSMLRDAALALLDLSVELAGSDSILQDCYPWNVVFRGPTPVIVDFTSIVPSETWLLWPAYEQFQAFFLRPLRLASQKKGSFVRALLYNNIFGISVDDLVSNSSTTYKITHPELMLQGGVSLFLDRHTNVRARLRQTMEKRKQNIDPAVRKKFFQGLIGKVGRFQFHHSGDVWTDYYDRIPMQVDKKAKLNVISECLNRLKPKTVADLGCNTGVFSVLAARQGASVLAMDNSEASIERLYQVSKDKQHQIVPLIVNVLSPTPSFGFLGKQYPSLIERAKSELVLCLGLMHHLHIAGRQSFPRIAEMMDCLSSRHLIFEYVDPADDNNLLLEAGRPIHYSMENVRESLSQYFPEMEILPSDRPTRQILVCSKRR
ncbi:MAG: class I SAM-dependent methyltransferase, partial [Acidobacteriota bacterium]